jgi:hypothetical protein
MQDEQAEQQDESVEPAADETTAEAEGAEEAEAEGAEEAEADAADSDLAAAVDQQAAESSGTAAEQEPEVPDDASQKIAAAQEHIDKLNMDAEREAAKRAI